MMFVIYNELQSLNIKWKIEIIADTLKIKSKKIRTLSFINKKNYSGWKINEKNLF